MSEQSNIELVQRAYRLVAAQDMESFLKLFAPEIVWEMPEIGNVPFSGSWRGREQLAKFFQIVADLQEMLEFQPEQFIAQGDKVVVLGHFVMLVKATGKESRANWAHVWTVHSGVVTHMREYVDTLAVSRAHSQEAA